MAGDRSSDTAPDLPGPGVPGGPRDASDPEQLLRQALRAHVGGPKKNPAGGGAGVGGAREEPPVTIVGRLSLTHILLIAAIIGLVVGMAVAFVVVTR